MLYLSAFPRYSIAKSKTVNPSLSPRSRGTPSNFLIELTMLTVETLKCFAIKIASSYLQLFCYNTLALQTTDRQTTYCDTNRTLQRSAKNRSKFSRVMIKNVLPPFPNHSVYHTGQCVQTLIFYLYMYTTSQKKTSRFDLNGCRTFPPASLSRTLPPPGLFPLSDVVFVYSTTSTYTV